MEDDNLSQNQMEELAKIHGTLEHITKLNRSLLLISKIENGQYPESSTIDVGALFKKFLPDYEDVELETTVLLDTLQSEAPALTREQADRLFHAVEEDYADVAVKRERMKKIKNDPYFNALQVKYAYAVTCHKAQGGQWSRVFVDQGYVTGDMLTPDYFRWLYTAFTRATEVLYLVNWPEAQSE